MTSRYQFSLSVPNGGLPHLTVSISVAAREVVWVVASVKLVSSPLDSSPGGGTT